MLAVTRALIYMIRQWKKTALMFGIFFVIGTAILSVLAVSKSVESSAKLANQNKEKAVTLATNQSVLVGDAYGSGEIPKKAIEEIGKKKEVESYSARLSAFSKLENVKTVPLNSGEFADVERSNATTVTGHHDSQTDPRFVSGLLQLVSGRHIQKGDKNKILVHEDLAQHNHLKIGDTIEFSRDPMRYRGSDTSKITGEIVGIFKGKTTRPPEYEEESISNTIMSDIGLAQKVFGYQENDELYTEAVFKLKNSADTQQFMDTVRRENTSISWQKYKFYETNPALANYSRSIKTMQSMTSTMFVVTVLASVIILTIILFFNVNGRMREIGILLSVGKSKVNILTQYFLENGIIATMAFIISCFIGTSVGQALGNHLIQQVARSVQRDVQNQLGGFSLGADSDSDVLLQTVKNVTVTIQRTDIVQLFSIGAVCIVIALLIASVRIFQLKPKEILNKIF
ncbi:ABC transporter permease [Streptococcus merionis]|uniref:ABC transporter permease n=1 Tax=Streptococcus merionis TaxID=400065 RepID=UPI003513532E